MGLFGKSRLQKLATDPIPVPRNTYMRHATGRIPEIAEVVAAACTQAGRDAASVDLPVLSERVQLEAYGQLEMWSRKVSGVPWKELETVLGRPDNSAVVLTNYLLGLANGGGVAMHNKYAELLSDRLPGALAAEIREGAFG